MRAYAGIGSRETPPDALTLIGRVAKRLADDFILRSGHASGADQAFELAAGGRAEIFLPWPSFEGDVPVRGEAFESPTLAAYELAAQHHPAWDRLGRGGRALHARNCHQVLGRDLDDPVAFVVCWTKAGKISGGTGQALRLALYCGVFIVNLGADTDRERMEVFVDHHQGC